MIVTVGIQVYLGRDTEYVTGMADPEGVPFHAAGDFDRLLTKTPGSSYPLLGQIDPHGDLELGSDVMPELIRELDQLLPSAGSARRTPWPGQAEDTR